MLTVTADSAPRLPIKLPICRFTISRTPPFRLSFHLCVSRCTGVCPVGSSVEATWFLGVVTRAKRRGSVARGLSTYPSLLKDEHYVFYLSHTTGGWVSLTHHGLATEHASL
jgi:hypothetical protein